ncbi:ATP-dependent RNA helicase [Candidatus Woesearchaeota archaeon CG10_big_fil_rev_8_21_14_0_10_36_11]|nr:MAG: ATP-dependent RNA helicase [Candidatus Woesearchaeota archaeon CG10_big_fil_rev_8_21_14_0_10_36_11]
MTTFEELHVTQKIVNVLKEEGIVTATDIQEKTIPLVHEGKDVIGISRTGSGKTAAFGVPLLEKMNIGKGVQGLVLAPTRELANQISIELRKWGHSIGVTVATIFGGVAMDPQIRAIQRSEVIVATPGRMLDHLMRGNVNLSKVAFFVLDEADKMVEMGFIEDIEKILSATPSQKQILLFGATISNEVDDIRSRHMHNVVVAETELHVQKDLLEQYYYNVNTNEKFSLLVHLLKQEKTGRVIIFCSKRSTVELVNKNLRNHGIKAEMLHGKMSQNKRLTVIERFNKGKTDYLVASSVAARGLDIKDVTHVFNYDLSKDPQEYVHRVGRTARAGESGKAITLLSPQDHGCFHAIFNRYDIDAHELQAGSVPRLKFEVQQQRNSFGDRGNSYHGNNGGGYNPRRRSFGDGPSARHPRHGENSHSRFGSRTER